MRYFDSSNSKWDEKVNFVDDNNVFVGYDLGQDCCEYADWYIGTELWSGQSLHGNSCIRPKNEDLVDYQFDQEFFQHLDERDRGELDGGSIVAFRLVAEGKPDLYLHLFNCHNGYYGHGFEFKIGDTVSDGGVL